MKPILIVLVRFNMVNNAIVTSLGSSEHSSNNTVISLFMNALSAQQNF